jgi:hypothetical protein
MRPDDPGFVGLPALLPGAGIRILYACFFPFARSCRTIGNQERAGQHALQEKVVMQRIGPHNPGLSRPRVARLLVLLMVSFYVGGLVIVFLYGFGKHPLS